MSVPTFTPGVAPTQYQLDWWNFSRPMMQAVTTTTKAVTSSTANPIPMDGTLIDRTNALTLLTGKCAIGNLFGYYWVEGFINWGATTTGFSRASYIVGQYTNVALHNGFFIDQRPYANMTTNTGRYLVRATTATDYVALSGWQDSGGSVNIAFAAFNVEYAGT